MSNECTAEGRRALTQLVERWVTDKAAHTVAGLVLAMRVGCGMPECTGPIQLPSVHAHDLARSHRTHEWRCDGCTSPGQANRYRCLREGCDFDLCQSCWDAACLFTWRDLRVGLKPELGGGSMTYGVGGMQVVSNTGPNTLPVSVC